MFTTTISRNEPKIALPPRSMPHALFAIIAIFAMPQLARAAAYTILDLGAVGPVLQAYGYVAYGNLNASGQVAGFGFNVPTQSRYAFRTGPNAPITAASKLGTMGGLESAAYSINSSGQTVGVAYYANQALGGQAFRTSSTGLVSDPGTNLGSLGGAPSVAFGINDSGQAVGYTYLSTLNIQRAFRTAPNAAIDPTTDDLGTLGGTYSIAYGINSSGQTVGESNLANGAYHAFRTTTNGKINDPGADLGTLGSRISRAFGINASGQTIGESYTDASLKFLHAFRTTATGLISDPGADLGTLGGDTSTAYGINDLGQVVGASKTSPGQTGFNHAFFADVTGSMQDLNSLIPAGSGWILTDARGINDSGQISGIGQRANEVHAFLLTPTPEPGAISLLACGAITTLVRRRR